VVLIIKSGTENLSTEKAVEITMFEKKRIAVNIIKPMVLLDQNILELSRLKKSLHNNKTSDYKFDVTIDLNYSDQGVL
jgi:hypothetical protein